MGVGLVLPLIPYLIFHYSATGLPFPNTLYAKQQEYAALLNAQPVVQRWLTMVGVTLVGGQILLLPGFLFNVGQAVIGRNSPAARHAICLASAGWFAHLCLYCLRLPVTYQHGRYQMPVIPLFVLIGVLGTVRLLSLIVWPSLGRLITRTVALSAGVACLAFLGLGARAYATDVLFVQGEMVATAHWLAEHTPANSLIAAHDIGAAGYFANRPLLDLAGLVTPQVIPFINDDSRLIEFMQTQGVDFAVFFPDWSEAYRRMAHHPCLDVIYTTNLTWTVDQGRANMAVFQWVCPESR